MQWLPPWVTTSGTVVLPFSDRAAGGLAFALLADDPEQGVQRLREVLAEEAPLALWAVCRAFQRGAEIHTIGQLAEWLAPTALDELGRLAPATPPVSASTAETGAQLAATSHAVAQLAARIARHARIEPERAYFLGLLHAAPLWLAAAARDGEPLVGSALLPPGLLIVPSAVHAADYARVASAADCVGLALRMVKASDATDEPRLPGFRFDRQGHAAHLAATRRAWLQASSPDLLPGLLHKLARLHHLETRFEQTLETEKLDSLKELAYGAGHEINNPLANISVRAQTLLRDEHDPDRRRMLAAINTQAFRAHEMIADMMLFARPPQPKLEPVDLRALLGQLLEELAPQAAQQHTELVLQAPDHSITVLADPIQIAVAVRALGINALEALVTGGRVEIHLAEPAPIHESVQITVSDNGPGIPSEARRHLFDPFYSGREAGRGLGFGLSKCWRIVTMHGGQVDVDSSPGRGARFTISLPVGKSC